MKLKKDELIEWCWFNLAFDNCPNSWEDTYIEDILNGYRGTCHNHEGKVLSYSDIRNMFEEEYEELT